MTNKDELKVDGCGCGLDHEQDHEHENEHDTVTLTLDDGAELECPIIDIFEVESKNYIALLHPVDEMILLYKFFDHEDGTIEVNPIDDDAEFEKVSAFVNETMMQD